MRAFEISDAVAGEVSDLLNAAKIDYPDTLRPHSKINWLGLENALNDLADYCVNAADHGSAPNARLVGHAIRTLTVAFTGR